MSRVVPWGGVGGRTRGDHDGLHGVVAFPFEMIPLPLPPSAWQRAADLLDPAGSTSLTGEAPGARWCRLARANQRLPGEPFFIWLIMAGRGWGKTRTGAEAFDHWARTSPRGSQLLLAGRTPADVRDYALFGEGGLLTHHPDVRYEPTKRTLHWPAEGVVALIRSGANPEEFRGFSGEKAWLDELASWDYPRECWDNLIFGMRERRPQIIITTTPKPIDLLREIQRKPNTIVVRGSSYENRENLAATWVSNVLDPLSGTRLGRQEIEGELIEDVSGALWTAAGIDRARWRADHELPVLERIVVGIDPQGSTRAPESATGVVVAGRFRVVAPPGAPGAITAVAGEHFVVLEDGSLSAGPDEWAAAAIAAADRWGADRLVAERNFGGDMVESTLRTVRRTAPITLLTASRGKVRRAEPIAALYEQGRVHHRGMFARLEDEMCTFTPWTTEWSPNRMDALVWALSELSTPVLSAHGGAWGRRPPGAGAPGAAGRAPAPTPRPAGWRPPGPGAAAAPATPGAGAARGGTWGGGAGRRGRRAAPPRRRGR